MYTFKWAEIKFRHTLDEKTVTIPRIVLNWEIVHNTMAKTKTTPRATGSGRVVSTAAKHPTATSKFLDTIDEVLTMFNDSISSISSEEREEAYKCFATTYCEVFSLVWDKINSTDIATILDAVPDKELLELRQMRRLLNPSTSQPKVIKEQRKVPELEHILGAMTGRLPQQKLPSSEACGLIADIFSDLAKAHAAQAQAGKGLAKLATTVTPEQMTLLLAAAVPPTLQLSLPIGTISPLSAPPPQPATITTHEGCHDIMMFCKSQILPDPKANGFLKLERKYFDSRPSRMEVSTAFHCNVSQLTKALTGVEYHSGPHHYKPKPRESCKKTTDQGEAPDAPPPKKTTAAPSKKTATTFSLQKMDYISPDEEDTLESKSSSDSPLPEGLPTQC